VGRRRREGAKHWLHILTEIKNRSVNDVPMLGCDGLKGLPDAVETLWPKTLVQICVVHLLRNSFGYAARQDWDKIARLLKPVYARPKRLPWSGSPNSPEPGARSIRRS
jgi:transposase-like protein